jgi:hypothetical protein
VFQVDERVVAENDERRNARQIADLLVAPAMLHAAQFPAMPVERSNLGAGAEEYARLLSEHGGTPPVLDVVQLGIGADESIPEEGPSKVFAGVRRIDTKPKRRLHEVLQSQGVLPRQHVTFLSDGGDTVRDLPAYLHPNAEHILDWFHSGMRVEQLSQTARGFRGTHACLMTKEQILKDLERVKWFLWHGNIFRADESPTDLMFEVDGAIEEDREARRPAHLVLKKLARALEEFSTYINNNASGIVNYGERHRCGERISTGFVESTINQLVAKRFVKKTADAMGATRCSSSLADPSSRA